jgi:hypothetical protein
LEEEKKAKEQRDRRLIEQAKKIENLSSLVLNSDRDDRNIAFTKVSGHFFFCNRECHTEGEPWRSGKNCCLVTMRPWVQLLETTSCRNAGKECIHKTQSGRTLRKRDLRAPGCPREYHKMHLSHSSLVFSFCS